MKVISCKVDTFLEATIKTSWIQKVNVRIPIRKIMYMLTDPLEWSEIDELEINKDSLGEVTDVIQKMQKNDNLTLAEILLKIAGKHHNAYENEMIEKLLSNREFAINTRYLMGY